MYWVRLRNTLASSLGFGDSELGRIKLPPVVFRSSGPAALCRITIQTFSFAGFLIQSFSRQACRRTIEWTLAGTFALFSMISLTLAMCLRCLPDAAETTLVPICTMGTYTALRSHWPTPQQNSGHA
eukprot:4130032-Amphidinium_carterae.1